MTAFDLVIDRANERGLTVRMTGAGKASVQCPAHDDRTPSLSVRRVEDRVRIKCFAECHDEDVLTELGLKVRDLYDDPRGQTYTYTDGDGRPMRTVTRTPDKRFRQTVLTKQPVTLYRLPAVVEAVGAGEVVYLVEGEADVQALGSVGLVATTAPMGATNFDKVDASPLYGAHIIAVVDADSAGRAWAAQVRHALDGRAATLRFVQAASGKDAADHITAGHSVDDFLPVELSPPKVEGDDDQGEHHDPERLEDAHLAATIADRALRGRYCYSPGMGWMQYRRGCWSSASPERVAEAVRRDVLKLAAKASAVDQARFKGLASAMAAHRIRALVTLAKGILEVDTAAFDQHPDLLNVGNGVVHLPTGELRRHDPALLLTKATTVAYMPGATSSDWTEALTALPGEVAGWLQVRVGQAATGHATSDDLLPVLQGGGANGKTTITGAVLKALGGHGVTVPERVLLANPSDHPTELMTLRGARLALIEETPEARHLSVKRLKDTVGTPTMTARLIGQNNVTWDTTHSLLLTTNYRPRVDETDHGTWRRLALVRFPYTFVAPGVESANPMARPGVDGLRERLRAGEQGQHEAVLAWIVDGARRWYGAERVMPPIPAPVRADTAAWRGEADLICGFVAEKLTFDRDAHIVATDLYENFTAWIEGHGNKPWSDQTFSARFGGHGDVEGAGVVKCRTGASSGMRSRPDISPVPATGRHMAWHGIRFRTRFDDDNEPAFDQGESAPW